MRAKRRLQGVALITCVALPVTACGGAHRAGAPARTDAQPSLATTKDAIALYNDTPGTVHVLGCVGCGASGARLDPGRWLPLNLPLNSSRLTIKQRSTTTCLVIMQGVDNGQPLRLKVSASAASAC